MSAVVFKQSKAFNTSIHKQVAMQKLANERLDLARSLKAGFKVREYVVTANFCFHLGWGTEEPAHFDLPTYQVLLIVEPNGWVVKGARDSSKSVFQDKGDLIILDTGRKHEVVWNRHSPKPTAPWLYIFVDAHNRSRWSKKTKTKNQALQHAFDAVRELDSLININWLTAKVNS